MEVLISVAMALVVTLFLVNALLMLYTRSVFQHAADVGARAGTWPRGNESACVRRANGVISDLAGLYASGAQVRCITEPLVTTAEITARLEPLFPAFGPDWSFTIRASTATDQIP